MQKISVITVVFNGAQELQATIDSVVAQNYPHIEYVVIDGGSNDGTVALIQNNLNVIDKWISERDKGIYDAMNKGVALASGDFVIFMNAGDRFYSHDAISQCIAGVSNEDIVYGDHWVIGSRRNDGHHRAKEVTELPYGMICSHQSMFFRRTLLLKHQFSLLYGTAGDYECIVRLKCSGAKFRKSHDVLVSYFTAGGVSDVKRRHSIRNTYIASNDNYILSLRQKCYFLRLFVRGFITESRVFKSLVIRIYK